MRQHRVQKRVGALCMLSMGFCWGLAPWVHAETAVGELAPDFALTDTEGRQHQLGDYRGSYVVLEWYNPDCPFVKKHYSQGNMPALQRTYTEQGVIWLAINSSAPGKQGYYPPEELNAIIQERSFSGTALMQDADGSVGKRYGAKTTPHIFIINPEGVLIYAGAIDSISSADPGDIELADNYVREVLDAALSGSAPEPFQTTAYGCSVKYEN